MKTLLINPDSPRMYGMGGGSAFPLGLGYIAAVLEEFHDIEVIDIGAEKLDENSLISRISRVNPEIVGITSDTLTFQRSIEIAEMVKKIDEGIKVVIGGAHANALPTYPLNYECFDISIYGEGERTAVELWDKIENGQSHEEIKGIAWKQKDKIIINPRRELISNLDDLPFPARHLFPMDKYSGEFGFKISPTHAVSTSRGCPFSCSFCSNNVVFGRRYRSRSHENVVDEIELLISDFGAKGIYFREDIFTANKKRVANICNEIQRRGLEFEWICESRVNTINEEILRTMKNAGCGLIWFGIESGSQRTLDLIHKQITIEQSRSALALCRKIRLKAGASFLIGIPGEKIEDIYKTIEFAYELKPDLEFAWFNIYTGYPTSPLYEHVIENSYYEKDLGHGVLIIRTNEFNRKKLEEIQKYANKKVNKNMVKLMNTFIYKVRRGDLTKDQCKHGIKYVLNNIFSR